MIELLNKFILHASLIKGIGPKTIETLTNKYSDIKINFYNLSINEFIQKGLSRQKAELLFHELKNYDLLYTELALLKTHEASFLTPYNTEYPEQLKNQETYPSVLYQQKNISININTFISLAVVSSRETNAYGKRVIYKLFEELANQNIIIISGGAIGGDTYIHEAALANNLKTVSILGSGLGYWYPRNNTHLFKKIITNGGIIMSHFPINTPANKLTFPIRNSVIAGMAQATLIIQAGLKSGTLITANYALEYGKEVGAIPGYIDDIIMIESNNLIKQGAHCITCGNDILSMLNIDIIQKKEFLKNKNNIYPECTAQQKKILEICEQAKSIEEINELLNISIDNLYNELFLLMENNYILQDILGNWKSIS